MQLQPVDLALAGGGARQVKMRFAVATDRSQMLHTLGTDQIQPEIDFARWVLLAAFRGECRSSGYGVALTAAEQHGSRVDVQVQLTDPPAGAITLMVITYPQAFALLSRTDLAPAGQLSVHFLAQGQELAVVDANVQ